MTEKWKRLKIDDFGAKIGSKVAIFENVKLNS
jgi:hypothetical protein